MPIIANDAAFIQSLRHFLRIKFVFIRQEMKTKLQKENTGQRSNQIDRKQPSMLAVLADVHSGPRAIARDFDRKDGPTMLSLSHRQNDIVKVARNSGRVTVDELAARFDVTPQTIRKDLNELCERNLLKRTHGGALISSSVENVSYEARRFISAEEKRAIGIAAARQIPNGSSLFINIGTTTEEVANALVDHQNLLIITNNLNVAITLHRRPSIDVIVVGGPVRRADGAVVGAAAVEMIRQFKVDTAVIGASAIDADGSLLDYDMQEVHVSRAIIDNARRVLFVCDQVKLERTAPVRIGHISEVHTFVTDRLPSASLQQICQLHGVQVIETNADGLGADPIGPMP